MQDIKLRANENRGIHQLESGNDLVGWDEITQGSILPSFEGNANNIAHLKAEERSYSNYNSYTATVASWRVRKPVFNIDVCIDCFTVDKRQPAFLQGHCVSLLPFQSRSHTEHIHLQVPTERYSSLKMTPLNCYLVSLLVFVRET